MHELLARSAVDLARLVRDGDVGARELAQLHLDRIAEVNGALNAVVTVNDEGALRRAAEVDEAVARGEDLGPLAGVPITIKDSWDTAGVRTTGGTLGWVERVPEVSATPVHRLLEAGAVLLGKTATPDLTLWYETMSLVHGTTYNPYDLTMSPGGSSGGAAAIIAAGGAALDLGSDTGGSIRLPAHFSGVAGLKPTSGRAPRTGLVVPVGTPVDDLTQPGPMSRHVEDLVLGLELISGPDGIDPGVAPVPLRSPADVDLGELRVASYADNGEVVAHPAVAEAIATAVAALADAGASVTEARPTGIDRTGGLYRRIFTEDGSAWIHRILGDYGSSESMRLTTELGDLQPGSAADWTGLQLEIGRFRADMLRFLGDFDLIVTAAHANPTRPPGQLAAEGNRAGFTFTQAFNITGWPGVVVRAGTAAGGLPVGVQIVAGPWREDRALAAALVVEAATGGWQPPPL